ncbi:TPA: hypothetical protein KUN31_000116 [Enterobacter cloacae]|nr:hypothetical protein [Enterobacter cloacae]
MSEEKYYDYLVLGGVHDQQVFNSPLKRILEVPVREPLAMAKMYAPDVPAETMSYEVIAYKVIEHIREDGKHFFIASNDDLTTVDVNDAILKSRISPIN